MFSCYITKQNIPQYSLGFALFDQVANGYFHIFMAFIMVNKIFKNLKFIIILRVLCQFDGTCETCRPSAFSYSKLNEQTLTVIF